MLVRAKLDVHDHVVDEFDYDHISPGGDYFVVGMDDEYFRVIDDVGDPILYPRALFDVIDPSIPHDWVQREADGQIYVNPRECSARGFYEDYFDGDPSAVATFQDVLRRLLPERQTRYAGK